MAKNYYDYDDVQVVVKEKKGIVWKFLTVVLALIVLAAGVCACGYAARDDEGNLFKNPNFSTWHWSDNAPGDDVGGNGGNVKPGENNSAIVGGSDISEITYNGVTVYKAVLPRAAYAANGVSEQAERAYTISAEVLPDYATDKTLEWSPLTWANADSDWANGKIVTDYVTCTPTADGANSAVLACLQDFGEPIVLRVSSRVNPNAYATCTVNYYQRIKSCDFAVYYDGVEVTPTVSNGVYKLDYTGAVKDYTVELRPVYSNYTLTDTYTTTINGALSSTFGYTTNEQLNTLTLPAGLKNGDPELSENAQNWCNDVYEEVFKYDVYCEMAGIGVDRILGNTPHGLAPAHTLTAEEKQHPRCAFYLTLLNNIKKAGFTDASFYQAQAQYRGYQPSSYNYLGGTLIPSYNEFVTAVKSCNNNGVGVVEYTVNITGTHSNFETVLKLSYNDEFQIIADDIILSDTDVAF